MDRIRNKKRQKIRLGSIRFLGIAVAVAVLLGICSIADAAVLVDEEDLRLRWDNSIRYNYGWRMRSPQGVFLNSPNLDDGNRNFAKGTVTNRFDLLTEFDLIFKQSYGFRVSAAFWYDQRYHDALDNDSIATSNHFENGRQALGLPDQTKRWYAGPDGEVLDAFLFGRVEIAGIPINIKAGRHTVYWGESLLFGGAIAGIAYSQMPIDMAKGIAVPGTEAKELFRPLGNVSMQAQLTHNISLAGQYFFEWQQYRMPEAGSFLSPADLYFGGSEAFLIPTGIASMPYFPVFKGDSVEPEGTKNWGLALKWHPEWLGGSIGFYYRRFADMMPQFALVMNLAEGPRYFYTYGDEIDLYGISLSTKIMGVSIGSELSYRTNMPLWSSAAVIIPGVSIPEAGIFGRMPGKGETYGARGNTFQGVLNFMGMTAKTPIFDTATWIAEFTWVHWSHVTDNLINFAGPGGLDIQNLYRPYNHIDKVTEHAIVGSVKFIPTWFQVFPGIDLSIPMSYDCGLSGISAVTNMFYKDVGMWSVALSLDVKQKYKFDLTYASYFGDVAPDVSGGLSRPTSQFVGLCSLLKDRDNLTFTFKTTF